MFRKFAGRLCAPALLAASLLIALLPANSPLAGPVPPPGPQAELGLPSPVPPAAPARLSETSRRRLAAYLGDEEPRAADPIQVRWLGILVEFQDRRFPEEYAEVLDPLGVLDRPDELIITRRGQWFVNVMSRSNEYFRSLSGGMARFEATLHDSVPLLLAQDMGYYGDDSLPWVQGVHRIATEVVDSLDAVIDFSNYDLVTFIHAGPGQESDLLQDSPEQIWSGYVDFTSLQEAFADSLPNYQGIPTDDQDGSFHLQRFTVAPEEEIEEQLSPPFVLGALGVYVHQLGSYLGLLGLGDGLEPRGQGAGNFDLMSSGLWNALGFIPGPPSAFNRMLLGWAEPLEIPATDCVAASDSGGQTVEIHSFEQTTETTLLKFAISDREYFLVENRNQDADGDGSFTFADDNGNHVPDNGESLAYAEFDYFTTQANASDTTPGSGLFIWRIDEELVHLTFLWDQNYINAFNDHYGVMLLEADGYPDLTLPGFGSEAYGSDFDAFRDADSVLVATQTAISERSFPPTRSAEGADSGWRFHHIGPHGGLMSLVARYGPEWDIERVAVPDRSPAGDPLAADLVDNGAGLLEFAFAAVDTAGMCYVYVFDSEGHTVVDRDGNPETPDHLVSVSGRPAGAPAAGLLDGDALADLALLMEDGRLFIWNGAGVSLGGGAPGEAVVQLTGSGARSPLLLDVDTVFGGESPDPALEVFVLETLSGESQPTDSTRLRCYEADGSERLDPLGASRWTRARPGLPVGDLALGLEVPPEARGPEHPEPSAAFLNVCLVDTLGEGQGRVHRLQVLASLAWDELGELRERSLDFPPGGDAWLALASGDLDADGTDELLLESADGFWLWHTQGRYDGDQAGDSLLIVALSGDAGKRQLLPADLDGNGSLEAVAFSPHLFSAHSADGFMLSDWQRRVPQTEVWPFYEDPSVWTLALRDGEGLDAPLVFTRDGRLFPDRDALFDARPIFLGGNLGGSPLLADLDGDGQLELHGISGFRPVAGNTAQEDTLLTGARLTYWRSARDWTVADGAPAWAQGGADAARSRRTGAAHALSAAGQGSSEFRQAYPYPNPAGERVTWRVQTDSPDRFKIELYDLEGQKRWETEGTSDGFGPWDGQCSLVKLASGIYFYRIYSESSGRQRTGSLAVIR